MLDLSVILPLRDAETSVATMVRGTATLVRDLNGVGQLSDPVAFEVLTLDERSGDNTLSAVSLLHGQVPELRTVQDVEPGTAIARAVRVAQGRIWVVIDRPATRSLVAWAIEQVACGHRAALVPGEVLVLEHELGRASLARLAGGLVTAQQAVRRTLEHRGEKPAFSPAPDRGLKERTALRVRGAMARLGLARLDRPPKGTPEGGLL